MNKIDQQIIRNYYDAKNGPYTDTVLTSNNMSDIDSSGGVCGVYVMADQGVRSTRIDDQLEARIILSSK